MTSEKISSRRIFGSRAKWSAKDSSDLDLAIDAGRPLTKAEANTLAELFEDSDLPYKVDVVDWHDISESFRKAIEKDRVALPDSAPLSAFVDAKRGISYGIVQPGKPDPKGVPVIRVNNIRNGRIHTKDVMRVSPEIEKKHHRTRLQGGEVLLTLVGTLGELAITGEEQKGWNVARAVAVIPPAKGVSAKWLQICLSASAAQERIRTRATTTVQATLNLRDVEEVPIFIPPKSTKNFIEKTITALDEKIELNRQMNETLEATARALFKSWFVDFDPVRAKMEGRKPDGLSADIAALFPDTLADSPLGEIPKGWGVGRLDKITSIQAGFAFKSKDFQDFGNPVIKIKNINADGTVNSLDLDFVSNEVAAKAKKFELNDGDLLMAMTGATVGKFGLLVNHLEKKCLLNQRVARFIPHHIQKPWYIYTALFHDPIISQVINTALDSAQPNISSDGIGLTKIVIPTDAAIKAFNNAVNPFFEKVLALRKEMYSLAQLRDALLPKLISGELRVSDSDTLEEAV